MHEITVNGAPSTVVRCESVGQRIVRNDTFLEIKEHITILLNYEKNSGNTSHQ